MKKKLLFIFICLISVFMFNSSVKAKVAMYLQCNFTTECESNKVEWYEWGQSTLTGIKGQKCLINYDVFVPLTMEQGGSPVVFSINHNGISHNRKMYSYERTYSNSDGSKGCWLKSLGSGQCETQTVYDESPAKIVSGDGICPSGIYWVETNPLLKGAKITAATLLPANGLLLFNNDIFETISSSPILPVGKDGKIDTSNSSFLDKTIYVVYSFNDTSGEKRTFVEGYLSDGSYAYVGPNIVVVGDDVLHYQIDQINELKKDYWRVDSNFSSRLVASKSDVVAEKYRVCAGVNEENCSSYETLIDSNDSNDKILTSVKKWYNEQKDAFNVFGKLVSISDNNNLTSTSKDLNSANTSGNVYTFSGNYNQENFISDLENAYNILDEIYSSDRGFRDYGYTEYKSTTPVSSATSYVFSKELGISYINELATGKNVSEHSVNGGRLASAISGHIGSIVKDYLKSIGDSNVNIMDIDGDLNKYTADFFTSVSIMDANPSNYYLSSEQVARVRSLRDKFNNLVEKNGLDIYPVVDCKSLIGEDFIKKINDYLDIIKIAVPIILIGFGIIDFTKAIFASDDDKMKKAQKNFLKRIGISVLIFIVPIIVNALLQLANTVWPIISPNSCGIGSIQVTEKQDIKKGITKEKSSVNQSVEEEY